MLQRLILEMIRFFHTQSFFETGTHYGHSTFFVAWKTRGLKIYTCELKEEVYRIAKSRLGHFPNISVANESSEKWLHRLLSESRILGRPCFYLDAHWYDHWPLEDEVEIITHNVNQAIIIIDDFQVPGREDFAYDIGGGGSRDYSGRTTFDERPCNLELIKPRLNLDNHYDLLFPNYTLEEAYSGAAGSKLQGHVVIFQNLESEFRRFGVPEGYRTLVLGKGVRTEPQTAQKSGGIDQAEAGKGSVSGGKGRQR
ncbi:MAG: hypothetical protein ACE5JS_08965 [Nitrospinota bacterium]